MRTRGGTHLILSLILLIIALGAIAYGVVEKEHLTVLQKSTVICMECIGLG